ncbi:hypothetical protein [Virgisporangium aurantiacum]|uniref:hypothetical protein n=1 Tax=Virgisporangium aurantiacum TaxID=175570 RepID=UPI0019529812|nr:hypothetical protein [Virgisporangium aurantiacum]
MNDESGTPPPGYREPALAWAVEYTDERDPGSRFQAGAFTTEAQAQKLLDQLVASGRHEDLWINMIPVHETVEDWEWDR